MDIVHVLAAIEVKGGVERFIYLDENEKWTDDLQKAKVYEDNSSEEVDQLEETYECMAWSVYRKDDGSLQSLWEDTPKK